MTVNVTTVGFMLTLLFTGCASHSGMQTKGVRAIKLSNVKGLAHSLQPKKFALLIGCNTFNDQSWPALSYAAKDALDMASALEHFDYVKVLTAPEDTSKQAVLDALYELQKRAQDPADEVFVYISSHGTLANVPLKGLRRFIVLKDTHNESIRNSALSVGQLLHILQQMESRRKAVMLATCYSGSGKSAFSKVMQEEIMSSKGAVFIKPLREVSEATIILSASGWGETAREDKGLKNDIYTHFFIEGMLTNDRNQDGAISISEAHDYARYRTYYFSQGKQRPSIMSNIMGMDPMILRGTKKRDGKPLLYSYQTALEGVEVEIDGQAKGLLPGAIAVDEGAHTVTLRDPRGDTIIASEKLTSTKGEKLELGSLLPKPAQYSFAAQVGYAWLFSTPASVSTDSWQYGISAQIYNVLRCCNIETSLSYQQADISYISEASNLRGQSYNIALLLGIGKHLQKGPVRYGLSLGFGISGLQRQLSLENGSGGISEFQFNPLMYSSLNASVNINHFKLGFGLQLNYWPVVLDERIQHGLQLIPLITIASSPSR